MTRSSDGPWPSRPADPNETQADLVKGDLDKTRADPPRLVPTYSPTRSNTASGASPSFTPTQSIPPVPGPPAAAGRPRELIRTGPGVPAVTPASPAGPTAEEVWRTGLPAHGPRSQRPLRRRAGSALTVALLIASAVVIYLRLHHAPFGVTGVAITQQVKAGCTVDVTGRISTTGAAGTVSYQWTFQPQRETPQPMSQSVAAGQSAVYVTASIEGQGHGQLKQTATLRVMRPGQKSASAPVIVSC